MIISNTELVLKFHLINYFKEYSKFYYRFLVDVNECSGLAKDACGEYGHCINTKPGWYCDCEQGFYNKTIGNLQTCTGKILLFILQIPTVYW